MKFYIVQPYASGPSRFQQATVVSEHATAAEAYAELRAHRGKAARLGLPWNAAGEMYVVDENRNPVTVQS
jgi:hypothetical protein